MAMNVDVSARLASLARHTRCVVAGLALVMGLALQPSIAIAETDRALLQRLTPAALRGDREAIRAVAKAIVSLGPRDFASASALRPRLRSEAEMGSSASAVAYGMLLQYGIGGRADIREAPAWYARGASTGNRSASSHAALSYALGWGVRRDTGRALRVLSNFDPEVRAKRMIEIAEALLQPGREEPAVASEWLDRAIALQTPATARAVDVYERIAPGDAQTAEQLRTWLREAAERGDLEAAIALGGRLMTTLDPEDRTEAVGWFLQAADADDPRGIQALTILLAGASGPARTDLLAALDARAKGGSNAARISLAAAYSYGSLPTRVDQRKGTDYLTLAARDGDVSAQYKLGMMLLGDATDTRTETMARAYLSLAALGGSALATDAVAAVGAMPEADARALVAQDTSVGASPDEAF